MVIAYGNTYIRHGGKMSIFRPGDIVIGKCGKEIRQIVVVIRPGEYFSRQQHYLKFQKRQS